MIHERCLRCDHWNHGNKKCDRVLKARMYLGMEGGRISGDLNIETAPGLLTKELENDLAEFLSHWLPTAVERWQGWAQVAKLHEGRDCGAHHENKCVQEFGKLVLLNKPLQAPDPLQNLDEHGLFKSDIALW
jgi:hypothetical protein